MLSVTVNTPKPPSLSCNHSTTLLSSPFLSNYSLPITRHPPYQKPPLSKPISATITPSSSPPNPSKQQPYQPFRPPPSPIPPQFRSLDINGRLEILANRLGLWFEYAPLIPSLIQEGFSPPSLEEQTGISGVEQNRLVVATQVRESLVQSNADADTLAFFDLGGAELLYEIRLLSTTQRVSAARFTAENKLDGKGAQELARAMKDFPRRRGDRGWESFNYALPGDCLSFTYYRQALEYQNSPSQRESSLEKALEVAESEGAKKRVLEELEGKGGEGEGKGGGLVDKVRVPVVRLNVGEVAESTVVVMLPVCSDEREVVDAPWECGTEGEFSVLVAEKGWRKWVVLPAWEPVAGLKRGGAVVAFDDARALPWRVNRWYKEEAILVVADRERIKVAAEDGFYLVSSENDGLKVERGSALKEIGVEESLGTVVLVVRPPREGTDNQLGDEDWV